MQKLHKQTTVILNYTSSLAHVVISIALVVATLLLTAYFFYEVLVAIRTHTLIDGFMHALGIMLLLWTMVELINTEIRYLQGGAIDVAVFLEVALVVVVREIIMLPVKESTPTWVDLGTWVGAATLLGLTYALVRLGQHWRKVPENQ